MAEDDHSRLIRAAARTALSPLGFQQKGRSRLWFADRGYWALLIEFQPSGFSKGSYLNIAAMWLWQPANGWVFNYCKRAGRFIRFSVVEHFNSEIEKLAALAAAEAAQLDERFRALDAIAGYLKEQANDAQLRKNPWTLYHAMIGAGLTGDENFGFKCFSDLAAQEPHTDWMSEMQTEAATLAKLLSSRAEFRAVISRKVSKTREALKLPPLNIAPEKK
jgi:hypothetical protein